VRIHHQDDDVSGLDRLQSLDDAEFLDCLFDARIVTQRPDGPQISVNQDRYRRCMTDKGYTLEKSSP